MLPFPSPHSQDVIPTFCDPLPLQFLTVVTLSLRKVWCPPYVAPPSAREGATEGAVVKHSHTCCKSQFRMRWLMI